MSEHSVAVLTVLRLATLAFAAVFLWYTLRAYLRHRGPSMLFLLVAVGLMAAGVIIEGAMVQFLGTPLDVAHIAEAVTMLLAFAVLVFSVVSHRVRVRRDRP